ncbi:MAG: hypothetical protein AABW79_00240 [Nanoarchaeota archaeon]
MTKGVSHIEVIISFILFVGFVAFGLYFFNPVDNTRVLDSVLYYATDEVMKNLSTNVYIYGVNLVPSDDDSGTIVGFLRIGVFGADAGSARGVRVQGPRGEDVPTYYNEGKIYFSKLFRFLKFSFGDLSTMQQSQLTQPQQGALELAPEEYVVSSSEIREIYSESSALILAQNYNRSYEAIKEKFNIPRRTDFDFYINLGGEKIVSAEKDIPENIEVYSAQRRIEIIRNSTGEIDFADLVVRVW